MANVLSWWRQWWHLTDQFDWFSVYLRDRGLQKQWRWATFVFTVGLGIIPLVLLVSPAGPTTPLARGVAVAATVAGFAASLLWLVHWPTRSQSLAYSITCCGCITAACLMIPNPYGGLMGCTAFAALGGFIAYFHALRHVLINFLVAMGCASFTAARMLADTGDHALVVSSFLLVFGLNTGVPFGIHSLVHALHTDLRNSDRDPLTGLLNRRSFYNGVHELLVATNPVHTHVNISMVDLDDFKRLNDTRGHAAGDEALVAVAAVLIEHCGSGAVLGRLGGEEFVVADVHTPARHAETAERIREHIARATVGVTASLGICSCLVRAGAAVEHPAFVDRLLRVADEAMYEAKRAGGNRVTHRRVDHH